ncbi:MAG TPA: prolyl oligopeptidase family serine peptidase [Rhizomicrobium sp.]|nr:prolyl oligopeptidase family serine peptidase [Rhizomicrobium sp.]
MRALCIAAAMVLSATAAAATPVTIHDHDDLALAPRGDRVVDIEALDPGNLADDPHGKVVLRDTAAGKVLASFDPCKTCKYSDTTFSPSGDAFAFVATDRKKGTATLYAVEGAKAKPRALAVVKGVANTPRYSHDGTRIALLVTIGAHKLTGAVEAGAALTGEIGESNDEQRIAILPAKGGPLALVSPGDTYVYEYDWAPGGFVATTAKGNGDNNWWIATLDFIGEDGALRNIAAPKLQIELPRVSPDGKTVAFIGGLMSDWQSIGGDIYTVPLAGGEPGNLTPQFKGSYRALAWRRDFGDDGQVHIATAAIMDDSFVLGSVDGDGIHSGHSVPATARSMGVKGAALFIGGMEAFIVEDFNHAFEIAVDRGRGHIERLTHDNDALAENVAARNVHWSNEGFQLQGWLVGPKNADLSKKYPMIVIVHGGPSSAYTPHYIAAGGQHGSSFDFAYELIQKGYYLFYPNDRGSYGQGEAFTRANVRDFGGGDLRDMLAGIDAVEKIAPIDDARLGLYGHSYGGWFSMWANTQTRRFKAFVAGAGIANWTSYYGQNGIDQWMIPFFGASVYDDPAAYRASSPIEFIKGARTPMFLYVGERDVECPAPQSLEYWHALKTVGTPVELHIYAGEGHHFRKLNDLKDLRGRIVGWYDRYLKQ